MTGLAVGLATYYYKKAPLQGGITVESKVSYSPASLDHLKFLRSFYANAQYEPKQKVYFVPISGKALTDSSRRIYCHLSISGSEYSEIAKNELFLRDIVHRLRLPAMFGHSHTHCIPNTNPAYSVDYFLIPSYEVLRYFFLHSALGYYTPLEIELHYLFNNLP